MAKVLITPRSLTKSGHPAFKKLEAMGLQVIFCTPGKQPTEDELVGLLPGCVAYLAGVEPVTEKVLQAAKDLKVISRNGSGIDNIDRKAADRLKIKICRTEGANANGVAELTIALIFALARSIPFSDASLKKRAWERRNGIELSGKVLGLIGCGEIGKKVALMASGIGMKVIAFRRNPDRSFAPQNFTWVSQDDVLAKSDIVSVHCPASADGTALIDKAAIARMKKGAYLVNTARASLVDDAAVLEGLNSGQIAGAAVDVFAKEPPADYTLAEHSKVIVTPHIGGFTTESVNNATVEAVENIINTLK